MLNFSRLFFSLLAGLVLIFNAACVSTHDNERAWKDPIDREIGLSRKEFKDTLRPIQNGPIDEKSSVRTEKAKQPLSYAPIILAPDVPASQSGKLVSLSVTEDVPIKDVLLELSKMANLELALDPNISGGVIMKVYERPVNEVIALLCDLAFLRYSLENGVLRVQQDSPYLVNYQVDYINLVRSSKGGVNIQTQVLSVSQSGGSGTSSGGGSSSGGEDSQGLNSGSNNSISTSYDGNLWASLEENIKSILKANMQNLSTSMERTQLANNNTQAAATTTTAEDLVPTTFYAINKQAGIISVMANSKKQKEVEKYLEKVRNGLSAQVLIEATIVEVTLNEEFATGIDWSNLRGKGFLTALNTAPTQLSSGSVFTGILDSDLLSISKRPSNIAKETIALKFLEGFGTTRVVQKPRATASHGQQTSFTAARNKPYFTVQGTLQQSIATTAGTISQPVSITSQLNTIPVGVILTLQPSINTETQEITMNIRPTISKEIVGAEISDPAVEILNRSLGSTTSDIVSKIPVIEVREMDTMLKIRSGEVMVIGGLIENADTNMDVGVPIISGIPVFGNLLKAVSKKTQLKETVILIRATIIGSNGYYHPQDKKLYEQFAQDPRPLTF